MTDEYEKTINEIREKIDNAKKLRIKAETRLEQLNQQKQEIVNEIENLGIKPENLESEIEGLRAEIEHLIKETREILPKDSGDYI